MKTHVIINGKEVTLPHNPSLVDTNGIILKDLLLALDESCDCEDRTFWCEKCKKEPDICVRELEACSCKDCFKKTIELSDKLFPTPEPQKPFSVDNPPREFDKYYFVLLNNQEYFFTTFTSWRNRKIDKQRLSQNNCFRTREEAEAALKRVLQALNPFG